MKKILVLIPIVLALAGCGTLIPKQVEFFQKKVKALPEKTASQIEKEKQAAYAASLVARITRDAAVANHDPVSVTVPAKQTEELTSAVSVSLGPPESIPSITTNATAKLSNALVERKAELDSDIVKYGNRNEPLVGKKIEGTGLIRVPYFVYIGGILLLGFIVWTGLKLYGAVNPAVGLGVNTVGRIGGSVISRGFSEVVKAGEEFKTEVQNSELAADVKTKVIAWFTQHQKQEQSHDTKEIVQTLTKKQVGI